MKDLITSLPVQQENDPITQILQALDPLLDKHSRLLIGLDGRCASGKTTLAGKLSLLLKAPVIHTDDFVVPHNQKTAERLAQPGGNSDTERLLQEIVLPWQEHRPICYRPYDCHTDQMMEPVLLPESPLLILEGSYCLHPILRPYIDLCCFMDISAEIQQERILRRNGEARLPIFLQRWIPLEEAYFQAFHLPDPTCILIKGDAKP